MTEQEIFVFCIGFLCGCVLCLILLFVGLNQTKPLRNDAKRVRPVARKKPKRV